VLFFRPAVVRLAHGSSRQAGAFLQGGARLFGVGADRRLRKGTGNGIIRLA
jgi:hypothetical protein